jgi:hypothetical protein
VAGHDGGGDGGAAFRRDWRLFAPFLVLVCLALLLLYRVVRGGSVAAVQAGGCGVGERVHVVRQGDTCWGIGREHGMSVAEVEGMNEGVDCVVLRIGQRICVRGGEGA